MGITNTLSKIFDSHEIEYHFVENALSDENAWSANSVALSNLATITLLKKDNSLIFAVFPASHHLNLAKLVSILKTPIHYLNIAEIHEFQEIRDDLDIADIIAEHHIQVIIDLEVSDQTEVLFQSDTEQHYLCVNSQNLEKLIVKNPIGCQFSEPKPEFEFQPDLTKGAPGLDLSNKINDIKALPILPDIAAQILQLQNNANASVGSLAQIVAQDPALASLILKYANSALFGQRGKVNSISDAILRVLGFDTVLYLAIGLAMGNSFKLVKSGPLGSKNIWQHAVYAAAICQKLSQLCPKEFRPSPGQAYLAGLLHDIGFLVLASTFETEYFWLNKILASKPDVPITVVEHRLLRIHHTDLGSILLKNWNMPEFLTVAVSEHHNEDYLGEFCELSGLVLLVDRALKPQTHSDAFTTELPEELVNRLGLTTEKIFECVNEVIEHSDNLDLMVSAMSS